MTRMLAALAIVALCWHPPAHALDPTKDPVSPRGTPAVIDLPPELHIRNTGGMGPRGPGTGAGLCVMTSVQVAARWHGLTEMEGFQEWCTRRPGGSWPQKLSADIKEFAKQKGIAAPRFVQHMGGDPAFLELVYRTRRMPCQTWTQAHMVNGAHLDANGAAVIDNNRPGNWLWQTRAEYLRDWEASGPGWVFAWLAPPPPPGRGGAIPAPVSPVTPVPFAPPSPSCPGPYCPTAPRPRCPGPNCPRWQRVELGTGEVLHKLYDADGMLRGILAADGWHLGHGDGWLVQAGGEIPDDAPPLDQFGDGIDLRQLDRSGPRYWVDGVEVTRAEACAALVVGAPDTLTDDSGNHHLSVIVATEAERRAVAELLAGDRLGALAGKCHVQLYGPESWAARTRLTAKVTLHAPAPTGGKVIGTATGVTLDELLALLRPTLDPTWTPPAPPPKPAPAPSAPACPNCPSCPDCPRCTPRPDDAAPAPAPTSSPVPWLTIAAALAAGFAFRPTPTQE